MNVQHMPAGTKAQILRAVIKEKHPKMHLATIASRHGVQFDVVKHLIDSYGYPDIAKMRVAASELELEEARVSEPPTQPVGRPAIADPFDPAKKVAEKLGGDPGVSTYDGPTRDLELPTAAAVDEHQVDDEMGQLVRVKLTDVHVDPENLRELPREDEESILELADTMAELGLLQPITVRRHDGRLVIVMGHRRYVAARRLKWTTIPVIVRGPMLATDVIATMLIENGQRRDLNPIEEARGLRLLKTRSELVSDLELARKVGRSQPYVSGRLALLSLSAEDQAAIVSGDMTLVEGTNKGRLNSGKVYAKGQDKNWHLGPNHDLAQAAKARCHRLGHPKGRRVGGMACGECWESVIRADARNDFVDISQRSGKCAICEQPVERQVEPIGAGR